MKLCRFDQDQFGEVVGDRVYDIGSFVEPDAPHPLLAALPALRTMDPRERRTGTSLALKDVRLRSPIAFPGKIVAAPVNYRAHIDEASADPAVVHGHTQTDIGKAGLFLKATSSLAGAADPLVLRFPERRTDHEVELVAVIGATGSEIAVEHALAHVAGYAVGLDITLRGPEDRSFRKSIDGYSIVGPWLTTPDEIGSPDELDLSLRLNGELRQSASTRDMVFGVARLIAFASSFYTLYPGDIIFTGTPAGVGPIAPGDAITAAISGLGEMTVDVTHPH